jgi:hypothetical protein
MEAGRWVRTPDGRFVWIGRADSADSNDVTGRTSARETDMPDTTTTLSELFEGIRDCLEDHDLDAARVLRDGILESVALGNAWLTPEEQELLESF